MAIPVLVLNPPNATLKKGRATLVVNATTFDPNVAAPDDFQALTARVLLSE